MGTQKIPVYTVYIVSGSTKYDITPAIESIDISDQNKQIAKCVTIQLLNTKVGDKWLTGLLDVCDRVFLHANDGSKDEETFRGFVWERGYKSSIKDRTFQLKCYDNLIYFQKSDHFAFFSSGKSTKDVAASLCKEWGVKLEYTYESITHAKLALRGKLSDVFTDDLLDIVKDRTGKKYVILSEKDVMQIKSVGANSTIYHFNAGQNAIQTSSVRTMDDMKTKVIILGKADKEDRQPVEATVSGNTSKYGTIQATISRSENTSLEDAKKEAQSIIDEDGKPKEIFELYASDIPWIRKGDKVYVDGGDMTGYYIVTGIERTISNTKREMVLDLEKP